MSADPDLYLGLMSGTSLDGVDAAIVDFGGSMPVVLYCLTEPYPESISGRIQELTRSTSITLDALCGLDVEIAEYYVEVVHQALAAASISADSIKAIGSHGQTIHHNPARTPQFTLQIGDPNTLCAGSGITTVADFRRRDMALGGQGAPLAPAFHESVFRSSEVTRVIFNVGGIANLTYLPKNPEDPVTGFDTGPGNTLLDYWINRHLGKKLDAEGAWAATGRVQPELLQTMISAESYFSRQPPKSTGTEYFNPNWLENLIHEKQKPEDIQATLLELTAQTMTMGINSVEACADEIYICGGGVHNVRLLERLRYLLPDARLESTASLGINPDYVEAIAFAWLARQTINQLPGNLPSVTKARSPAILGGIFQSSSRF
ncbi:MAG: anhydro-N-acetylmuramic acid kinase [Gammaproteobacteria bacterium]|nr:anhydro-N-acetylmuramic acid kinase [Gammaproteobacteria bacterium]